MIAKPAHVVRLIVVAGLVAAVLAGCASSGPEVGAAESALEEGNYESALANLEEALERDSANVRAYEKNLVRTRRGERG